jgi:hypothetical protein
MGLIWVQFLREAHSILAFFAACKGLPSHSDASRRLRIAKAAGKNIPLNIFLPICRVDARLAGSPAPW